MSNIIGSNLSENKAEKYSESASFGDSVKGNISAGVNAIIDGGTNCTGISLSEMKELIASKIQNLPPLPKTVIEIDRLRNSDEPNNEELLKIIQTDPMIVANILKVSNSAMYGFSRQIKTAKDALSMLGFKMVSNIAVSTAISGYLKPDLDPYGISLETFTDISSMQSKIIDRWTEPSIRSSKNDLGQAAFLQEVGKLVISMVVVERNLAKAFNEKLNELGEINTTEEQILGQSTAEITSLVFTHWKFNQKMINYIKNSDRPEGSEEQYRIGAQALKIAKIIAPVSKYGITDETIEKATLLSSEYGFDEKSFENLTYWIKEKTTH